MEISINKIPKDGKLHFISIVRKGRKVRIFIDGKELKENG